METQATAAKKTTAAARKAAAAAKFGDNALATAQATPELAVAQSVTRAVVEATGTAGTGLKAAKAATKKASRAKVVKGAAAELEVAPVAEAHTLATQAIVDQDAGKGARKAPRAKKAAAKDEPPFEPVVVKDGNNHSAIAVAATARTVELIPMDSAGMTVTKISRDRFAHDYKPVDGYAVGKAAKVYLTQTIAMDPKAKAVLELLASAEADKPIASGTLVALMSKHDEAATVTVPAEGTTPAASTGKAPRAARAKAAPADREAKPVAHRAPADAAGKKIAKGDVKVESKVQPGSFRAARHNYLVSMAGKTVAEVLGASTLEGKRGIAYRDVEFAVSHGFIKLV